MDAFIVVLSLGAFLGLLLVSSLKGSKKGDKVHLPRIVMGETIVFLFGKPDNFVFNRMKKYSPDNFKTRILGEDTAVICGPNGHKFLFSNEHKPFTAFRPHSMQWLFRSYKAALPSSPLVPAACDKPAIDEEAKVLKAHGFLKPEALVRYLGKIDSITQHQMKTYWEGRNEVKAFPHAKSLTLTLSCRFFLGTEEPERIARLVKIFDDVTVGMHSITLVIPGMVFHKAQKAATAIRTELRTMIKEKKAAVSSGAPMHDILSHVIMATD